MELAYLPVFWSEEKLICLRVYILAVKLYVVACTSFHQNVIFKIIEREHGSHVEGNCSSNNTLRLMSATIDQQ